MNTITIPRDVLVRALAAEVKARSFGVADLEIRDISGFTKSEESFPIEGVQVSVAPRRSSSRAADTSGRFTPAAGLGKIRIAAVDGEVR